MTTIDPEEATALVMRIFSILASGKGDYTATPKGPLPGPDQPHELGEFIGEGFFHTADITARLAKGMGPRQQDALMRGVTQEWWQAVRGTVRDGTVGSGPVMALAFLSALMHAALHGAKAAGADLADAHQLSMQLQEQLMICAGVLGVADAAMEFLAEQPEPGTK